MICYLLDMGCQVRSYVLAPYLMVKDHRHKGLELTGKPALKVLDGELEYLLEQALLCSDEYPS